MQLHILTSDDIVARPNFRDLAKSLITTVGTRGVFHLRTRLFSGQEYVALAHDLARHCEHAGGRLIVNERVDVALAANAHGVQLGSTAIFASQIRESILPAPGLSPKTYPGDVGQPGRQRLKKRGEILQSFERQAETRFDLGKSPARFSIGTSVHSIEDLPSAEGSDWIIFGHLFETPSHPGIPGQGLGALRHIVQSTSIPIIAVGGIRPSHVGTIIEAGAAGVAVISGIWDDKEPNTAVTDYLS